LDKPLVIVESPTKIRTLKRYLGKDYNVAATVGHIKDLPAKEMGIDIEDGFKPKYRTIPGKQKVVQALKKAAGSARDIYLAPDPDREGEAIAWHAAEVLKKKGRNFHRVLFHELTRNAILSAIAAPEGLNANKYEAQQARRILDRLVGYNVSPLLWRKVKRGLSAGRVQSVAVRIICERERAIQAFEPQEYWSITANLLADHPPPFDAKLVRKNGEKIHITNEKQALGIVQELSENPFVVEKVLKKTRKRNPLPPFITSKLQQEAIRKLHFTARKTMVVAQQLYEGISLGTGEPTGLITYMRTDSTRIAAEAANHALSFIREHIGQDYAIAKPRFFKNRKKVQDAHEAIRPTSVDHTPEKMAAYLSADQLKLYRLIWQRFVASQMKEALIDQNSISIRCGVYLFNASGSSIRFPGFMKLYQSADDEIESRRRKEAAKLPEIREGAALNCRELIPKQHFTAPPPRFSEASLVKELEENGIGRPSTYASILSTIRGKGYVELVKGYFHPSELGFVVNDLLVSSFPDIFDVAFTARMEDELDRIEAGNTRAIEALGRFYHAFRRSLDSATERMLSMKADGLPTEITCPACGQHDLRIKMGKNGLFLACSGYPECTFTRNYTRNAKGQIEFNSAPNGKASDEKCALCGRAMLIKEGRYGTFLACSGYPECKHTQSLNGKGKDTGIGCPRPACSGTLVQRTSRRGRTFYGCSRFPDCDFAMWDQPVKKPCPQCGAPFLVQRSTKKEGIYVACMHKECGYREPAGDNPPEENKNT